MAVLISVLLACFDLITTQPTQPSITLNLYSKGAHDNAKPPVVIVEVSNGTDKPVRIWQSPVGHSNAYASDNTDQRQPVKPFLPPYGLSIVYLPDERPKLGAVLEAQGGRLFPFTELTIEPHATAYIRVPLEIDSLPRGKATIWTEMHVEETIVRSNALELDLN